MLLGDKMVQMCLNEPTSPRMLHGGGNVSVIEHE